MYIKYLKNIHNLNNFYSVLRSTYDPNRGTNDNCINLTKHDGNHISLSFKNKSARDFILNEIWNEIEKGSICYNIDAIIDAVYASEAHNM